jgi:2-aminoadipate transaminase
MPDINWTAVGVAGAAATIAAYYLTQRKPPAQNSGTVQITTTQSDQYAQRGMGTECVDFSLGQPTPSLLPWKTLLEPASAKMFKHADQLLMQYGTKQGFKQFRELMATFLAGHQSQPVTFEHVLVTAGSSVALSLVCQALCGSNDVIAVESATYFLSKGIFADVGVKTVEVAMDAEGLDVAALGARLKGGLRIKAIYTIPNYQNPTGSTLSDARKAALARLAAEFDFYVISDEPYTLLNYTDPKPPTSMAEHDGGSGKVISLGSFSKLVGPGLRLGWIQAQPPTAAKLVALGILNSGGGANPIVSGMMHYALASGAVAKNIATLREVLGQRLATLDRALRTHCPTAEFVTPKGGYFLWLKLPNGWAAESVLETAKKHGVAFTPGSKTSTTGKNADYARLSFAFYTDEELEEGARRLGAALAAHRE